MSSRLLNLTKEETEWVIENENKYKKKTEMFRDFYNLFHRFTYEQFKWIRRKLVKLENRAWTNEEKDFIVECVIDKEMTYPEILPLYNKKFKKNRDITSLWNLGKRLKIHVVSHRKINFDYEALNCVRKKLMLKYFENQCPVGTVIKISKHSLIIKLKLIPLEEYGKDVDKLRYNPEYWYPYPKYVYEKYHNVKLKSNEYIFHIDGDYFNNDISNLICVKNNASLTMKRLGLSDSTIELRRLGLKMCKLKDLMNEREVENER